jgi:ribosome-binding protein aMBF1 (putative translation factor)
MKKLIALLLILVTLSFIYPIVSIGQDDQYSVSLSDTSQSTKVVNLRVSNNPNITVSDKNVMDALINYKLEQYDLIKKVSELEQSINSVEPQKGYNEIILNKLENILKNLLVLNAQKKKKSLDNYKYLFHL